MSQSFDWLAAAEACERTAEEVESFGRRRRVALAGAVVVLLALVAWCAAPALQARRESSRPFLGATPTGPRAARGEGRPSPVPPSAPPHRGARSSRATPSPSGTDRPDAESVPLAPSPSPSAPVSPVVWVHVAGAVARPGVVCLARGSRGFHAVRAAGGVLGTADLTRVNLARVLVDEGLLIIPERAGSVPSEPSEPSEPEAGSAPPAGESPSPSSTLRSVDLNRASAEALQTLPGIGATLAAAIVSWRKSHGPFRRIEDVMRVPRIRERTFRRIRPYIRVGDAGGGGLPDAGDPTSASPKGRESAPEPVATTSASP